MLNIYIGKLNKELKSRYIKFNDDWFDMNVRNVKFDSDESKFLLRAIDRTHYLGDYRIESSFREGLAVSVSELSSGCKTAINISTFNDKIFDLAECGNNALEAIAKLDDGNCYMSYFSLIEGLNKPVRIIGDSRKVLVVDNVEDLDSALGCIDWGY